MKKLTEFSFPSKLGSERVVSDAVLRGMAEIGLSESNKQRLRTAIAEAVMNAIEHGNKSNPELRVEIEIHASSRRVEIRITDQGGVAPELDAPEPNIEAKLAGVDTPRGWGLFLIKKMVDDVSVEARDGRSTLTLALDLEKDSS